MNTIFIVTINTRVCKVCSTLDIAITERDKYKDTYYSHLEFYCKSLNAEYECDDLTVESIDGSIVIDIFEEKVI